MNVPADSPGECITLDCDCAYFVEADKPVVRNARIRLIGHLVDFGDDEHVPGSQLLPVVL